LLVSPYIVQRLPRHWEDPERFDPARFAFDTRPNNRKAAYFPFGIGPHACIGESYALTMMRLVLAMFWRRFIVELEPSHRVEPAFATSLTPRDGVRVHVRERAPGRLAP
jgi:cytochrome P450